MGSGLSTGHGPAGTGARLRDESGAEKAQSGLTSIVNRVKYLIKKPLLVSGWAFLLGCTNGLP
jgi:hypothetical protein